MSPRSSTSTASPRAAAVEQDSEGSDVELNDNDNDAPAEPVREYWGVSRAPAEVTENIVAWTDNVETDDAIVEELLQINEEEEEEAPNNFTHYLPIEQLYHAAIETVDENGGPSLSLPLPPTVTIHPPRPSHTGGYMNVIPELGTIREEEETQALEEQYRRDVAVGARWREYETVGVPVPVAEGSSGSGTNDGATSGRDHQVIPPASRA